MCYSLSQTCNSFQIDHSLFLRNNQINQEGLETEHIIGSTCARRTINIIENELSSKHQSHLENFFSQAVKNKWLLILVIDDYTSIHTKKRPQDNELTDAKNMCTIVIKAFKNIEAIPVKEAHLLHDPNGIDVNNCEKLITSATVLHDVSFSYASVMPNWLTTAFFNPELERERLNTHQYCDNDNVRKMRKMEDLHLIDFVELRLKCKNDFEAAYDIVLGSGLAEYIKKFVLIQPGDWPCQFYCRQIIYSSLQKHIQNYKITSPVHDQFSNVDHSYCFTDTSDSVPSSNNSSSVQPSILSIVPTIGPLHISLNSREHIVSAYHPFFKTVYEKIFPKSKLPDTPKPWRISLMLEIVYGAWTLIRTSILRKFLTFKDLEYATLFNLLDNYIPLVLSVYSITFKLNNFHEYFRAIIRIWIMFTCLRRRHYNKAPLVWLNMCCHWGRNFPEMYNILLNYLTITDEYPVENTHSILRAQTKPSDTAAQLTKKAKTIFQSKEKQCNFRSYFTSPKKFSFSHKQLKYLKVKCAEVLSSMFTAISQSPGKSSFPSKNQVILPNVCSSSPVKCTVLPMGYQGETRPNDNSRCDLPACKVTSYDEEWKILNGCFHSFHTVCLDGSSCCPLCKSFLKEKVQELGKIAKNAILNPASDVEDQLEDDNEPPPSINTVDQDQLDQISSREMEDQEFTNSITHINTTIESLNTPPQPQHLSPIPIPTPVSKPPHCKKCNHPMRGHKRGSDHTQIKCRFCPGDICATNAFPCTCTWHVNHQNHPNTNQQQTSTVPQRPIITISEHHHTEVTEWILPAYICQTTIGARNGSNSCTVIALLSGLHYLKGILGLPKQLTDLNKIIPIYSRLIQHGNNIYDSFNIPPQTPNLEPREVLQRNDSNLTELTLTEDTGFFDVQHLKDYLLALQARPGKQAGVLIVPPDKSLLICLSPGIVSIFDSHGHGSLGGLIASSTTGNLDKFVAFIDRMVMAEWKTSLRGANLAVLGLR